VVGDKDKSKEDADNEGEVCEEGEQGEEHGDATMCGIEENADE